MKESRVLSWVHHLRCPVLAICEGGKLRQTLHVKATCTCVCPHLLPLPAPAAADCGQSEFTPPGLVSLTLLTRPVFGPPHMHHRQPVLSYFLGDLSPASDPLLYLRLVRELFCWYCHHGAAAAAAAAAAEAEGRPASRGGGGSSSSAHPAGALPPLVVNTHGWVKGLGLDVLGELLASLQPLTHLVQLCSPNPHKNLPEGVFWAAAGDPSQPPPAPLTWQLPALGGGADAQPTLSGVSQSSARTTATATTAGGGGGEDGGGRGRGLSAVESRALQWGAFAQQCIAAMHSSEPAGSRCSSGSGLAAQQQAAIAAAGTPELADGIAALVPYELSMDDVDIQASESVVPRCRCVLACACLLPPCCHAHCPAADSSTLGHELQLELKSNAICRAPPSRPEPAATPTRRCARRCCTARCRPLSCRTPSMPPWWASALPRDMTARSPTRRRPAWGWALFARWTPTGGRCTCSARWGRKRWSA